MFLVRKRLPTAFVYLYTQCLFLVVLLLLLLSVKLLSAEFAAVRELSDEKFNGPLVFLTLQSVLVKYSNMLGGMTSLCVVNLTYILHE